MPKGPGQLYDTGAAEPAPAAPQTAQQMNDMNALRQEVNQKCEEAKAERAQIRDSIQSAPATAIGGGTGASGKGGGTEASGGLAQHAQQTNQAEQDAAAEEQRRLAANPYGNISLPDFSSPGSFSIGGK